MNIFFQIVGMVTAGAILFFVLSIVIALVLQIEKIGSLFGLKQHDCGWRNPKSFIKCDGCGRSILWKQ